MNTKKNYALFFFSLLAFYFLSFARDVTFVDSGELTLSAWNFGVAHPPGFPLYTLIGHVFSKIPLGTVAARLAFMSAFFGAVTATIMAYTLFLFISSTENRNVKSSGENSSFFLALLGGLALALGPVFLSYASVVEVYTLHLCLNAALLALLLSWSKANNETQKFCRPSFAIGLIYGLMLCVHHVSAFLLSPGLLVFACSRKGVLDFLKKSLPTVALGVVCALPLYVLLPLAASRDPILNWGNPSNVDSFVRHVSGKQYHVALFGEGFKSLGGGFLYFCEVLFRQFHIATLFLFPGFALLWHSHKRYFWMVFVSVFTFFVYFSLYQAAEDKDAYYLTPMIFLLYPLTLGFHWFVQRLSGRPYVVYSILFAIVLIPNLYSFNHSAKRNDTLAKEYVENILRPVQSKDLILTFDWQFYSPYLYYRYVEGLKPDISVIDLHLAKRIWYMRDFFPKHFPEFAQNCRQQLDAYTEDLALFDSGKDYNQTRIQARYMAFVNALIEFQFRNGRNVFLSHPFEDGIGANLSWIPHGLLMKFSPHKEVLFEETPPLELGALTDRTRSFDEVVTKKIKPNYATMLANRGRYLSLFGKYSEAESHYKKAIDIQPEFDRAYEFLGELLAKSGKANEARAFLQKALELNPQNKNAQDILSALR